MTQPINPGSSKALTGAQVEMLMRQAGFPDSELRTGVGVAFAESSNIPTKYNGVGGDRSYGLFQINMIGDMGPDRRKKFGISKNEQLFDPATNVKAAYIVWKESGWKAWTTYTNGKYKDGVIPRVEEGAGDIRDGIEGVTEKLNPINGLSKALDTIGINAMKSLASGLGMLAALVLVVLGIVVITGQSKRAQQLAGTVASTVTKGVVKK